MNNMDMSEYVAYLPNYKVVICNVCKYCITPHGAMIHLHTWHKMLPLAIHRTIVKYCNTLELLDPYNVSVPTNVTPILELEVWIGRQCTMDGCRFISGKLSSTKAHARTHGWVQSKPPMWQNKSVQVLDAFISTNTRPFSLKGNMSSTLALT